jgi:hypothetical protein
MKLAPDIGCIVVAAELFRPPRSVRPARRASPPGCSRVGLSNGPFLQSTLRPLPPPEKIATLELRSRLTYRLG